MTARVRAVQARAVAVPSAAGVATSPIAAATAKAAPKIRGIAVIE